MQLWIFNIQDLSMELEKMKLKISRRGGFYSKRPILNKTFRADLRSLPEQGTSESFEKSSCQ